MVDFTVAIRTFNGETRIAAVLEKLRSQVGTEGINWEVIVVDNNSSDNTAKIVQNYQLNWSEAYPLKYYFEPQQGASFARKRAIQEAQGSLIGFLDDDNWPASDWLAAAYSFAQAHPQAGAYGSQIHGDFEVKPPQNFERIAHFIPVIERKEAVCFNDYKFKGVLPPGAGLVISKQIWLENVPSFLHLKGPVGNSLAAKGEDIEALSYIQKAGWEIWCNPKMHIAHRIPKTRFEKDYLIKFFRGIGLGRHRTRMLRYPVGQRPFMFLAHFANDLLKLIKHWLKYQKSLQTDIVASCEMELFLSSLISPFYIWKNSLLNKYGDRNSQVK